MKLLLSPNRGKHVAPLAVHHDYLMHYTYSWSKHSNLIGLLCLSSLRTSLSLFLPQFILAKWSRSSSQQHENCICSMARTRIQVYMLGCTGLLRLRGRANVVSLTRVDQGGIFITWMVHFFATTQGSWSAAGRHDVALVNIIVIQYALVMLCVLHTNPAWVLSKRCSNQVRFLARYHSRNLDWNHNR